MRMLKKHGLFLFLFLILLIFSIMGCQKSMSEMGKYYTQSDIKEVLDSKDYVSQPRISDIQLDKYPEDEFLFSNHCFSFYRDMDYFLNSSARYDSLDAILEEYPPQAVRTIENNGQKSMYFVYETDEGTRLYVFFFETDNYQFTRGYPIVVKKLLKMEDFSALTVGDSMENVEEIDPITSLYRKGYDTLSDEMIEKVYIKGKEQISTIHFLKDGIIRINYDRDSTGDYIINQIITSDDFIIPVLTGKLCYRVYADDYIE